MNQQDHLNSFFSSSLPSTNIFHELSSKDVEERFELRKKMYENKEVFNELITRPDQDVAVMEDEAEYSAIKEHISKGKEILLAELAKHKELAMQKSALEEFESSAKSICVESQQKVTQLQTRFDSQKFDTTELSNHIDGVMYSIGEIFELVNSNVKTKNEELQKLINANNSKIRYLSEAYGILKSANMVHLCPVCLTNEVNTFCDPCGHSFCDKCMRSTYCFMCRVRINKLHPLFFS
jgi:hypothetical protein